MKLESLKSIKIYADGPSVDEIKQLNKDIVEGLTFNPTLFKNLGIKDYLEHCKNLTNEYSNYPISLEVIADDYDEMAKQGLKLGKLADNVFVKIPITYTNANSTLEVLQYLVSKNIKLNITAVFTIDQVKEILPSIKSSKSIISVFSGRLFDIGLDAVTCTKDISDFVHNSSNCKVLWASPRMVYDIINAINANCDIITMPYNLIKKIDLFNKTADDYSLDTVKMFYNDAKKANYKI